MNKNDEKFVVGLEIGSSAAKIGIAGFFPDDEDHTLTVYNTASVPTVDSVRYGRIVNIRDIEKAVNRLLEKIEKRDPIEGRDILGVYISIGGRTLKSKRTSARKVLSMRREISEELVEDLRDEAIANLGPKLEIVCVEANRYTVDNIPAPRPVGSLGTRIYGEFTAVTCDPANRADIIEAVSDRVGLAIAGASARPIALAHLVLSPREINAGCMLVDFGAETTTVAIYKGYTLQYLATIPIGSRLITRDLAAGLAITEDDAEALKIAMANALPDGAVPDGADDRLTRTVDAIVSSRLADVIANIAAQPGFAEMKKDDLPSGIILTGGGAKMRNFGRLLEAHTRMKVRAATLPADIIIRSAGTSATDDLDLIALLNEAAEVARLNPDYDCISPKPQPKPEPEPEPQPQTLAETKASTPEGNDDVVFDIETTETTGEHPARDPRRDTGLSEYGYEPGEFDRYGTDDPDDDEEILDDDLDDDLDDEFGLLDDDRADAERRRRARAITREKEREQKARDDARRRQERETRRREEEERRQSKPGWGARFINSLTGFLTGNGEDNSSDLDD